MTTITKDILTAAKFASSDETRPALAGVLVTNDYYVATDSYKLVRIKREGSPTTDFPVCPGVEPVRAVASQVLLNAKQLLKKLDFPKKATLPILAEGILSNDTKQTIGITTTDLETVTTVAVKKIDEDFPKYETILPDDKVAPAASLTVNAELLRECLAAFVDQGDARPFVTLKISANKHEALSMVDKSGKILALLMPVRE